MIMIAFITITESNLVPVLEGLSSLNIRALSSCHLLFSLKEKQPKRKKKPVSAIILTSSFPKASLSDAFPPNPSKN